MNTIACAVCSTSGCKMFTCSWCLSPTYCGKRCQKKHWISEHRVYHYGTQLCLHVTVTRALSGESLSFDVSNRALVADVQKIIARDMFIPVQSQQLLCGGAVLSNSMLRMHFVREAAHVLLGETVPLFLVVTAGEDDNSDECPPLVESSDSSRAGATTFALIFRRF